MTIPSNRAGGPRQLEAGPPARLRVAALALLPLAGLMAAAALGQPPEGRFEEEVEVTEVLLDVLVTDAKGRVILGLREDDFVVEENGEPVEVTDVVFYSSSRLLDSSEELAERGVAVQTAPETRYFILFFQDQKRAVGGILSGIRQQLRAGKQIERWIREELLRGDRVAVVSYDLRLRVHQDFTGDREALVQAVERAVSGPDRGTEWPSRRPEEKTEGSLFASLPSGPELRRQTRTIYGALQVLARAAGGVRGRKNLVFVGRGFGGVDSFGRYDPEWHRLRPTLQALNDNNVAFYAVDLVPEVRHTLRESLHWASEATGGRIYFLFVSFVTPLRQIAEETSGYYLLSYRRERPAGESGYQRVRVGVRNPEFRVRSRQGYLYGGSTGAADPPAAPPG